MATPSLPAPAHEAKIPALQALRGVSILLVLFQHLSIVKTLLNEAEVRVNLPFWLGVEVFFVLSGYVIVNSLARDRYEPLSFMAKRVFRLTPAVLVFLGLSAAINWGLYAAEVSPSLFDMLGSDWKSFRRQARSIVFGYFLFQPRTSFMNGAMWSLCVEDQFYAGLAVACLAVAVLFRRRAARLAPAVVVGLAAVVYYNLTVTRLNYGFGGTLMPNLPRPWGYLLTWKFDFLAIGILIAYADRAWGPAIRAAVAGRGWFLAPVLLLVPLVAASQAEDIFQGGPWLNGLVVPLSGVCFAGLVLVAAHDAILPRWLNFVTRALVFLGDRSYTIYLMHFPFMVAAWLVFFLYLPWAFGGVVRYGLLQLVGTAVLMFPFVEVVYRLVEKPLTAVGRRVAKRVRIIPAEAADAGPAILELPAPTRRAA